MIEDDLVTSKTRASPVAILARFVWRKLGPLLQTWFDINSNMEVIISVIWCGMKSLIHSQTSAVQSLKFGKFGNFIPHFTDIYIVRMH